MNGKICMLILILTAYTTSAQTISTELKGNWQFRKEGDRQWMKAQVPGTVHTDLLLNKKIPDPFYRDNEKHLQWIENENWEYQGEFDVDQKTFNRQNIELVFNGLDTYAEVYLNEEFILKADNMFRTWRADIKKLLRPRNNHLYIRFASAQAKADSMARAAFPLVLPGNAGVYVRKAQYHFGSEWGPKFTTCGIWRKVQLEAWDEVSIEDVFVKDFIIDSMYRNNQLVTFAQVETEITINSRTDKIYNLALSEAPPAPTGRRADGGSSRASDHHFVELLERIYVKKGRNRYSVVFGIRNPELWWCKGLGKQKLYQLNCELFDAADMHAAAKEQYVLPFALRRIELVTEDGSKSEFASLFDLNSKAGGKAFYFRVNGIPVFIKGANYVPLSPFLPGIELTDYKQLIENAKAANINMLRVSGCGIYEDDAFYRLCDENGILIWQDLMFASGIYPAEKYFLENVREELEQNVKRLRNHPSIALWCGNNETEQADLQHRLPVDGKDSLKMRSWYEDLFLRLAPGIIQSYDAASVYLPSSSFLGWGRSQYPAQKDSYYAGLWQDENVNEDSKETMSDADSFVSAYGLQSLPAWSTIESYTKPEDRDTSSPVMKLHDKTSTGYYKLASHIQWYFNQPKDFESYAYLSQCLQAYTLKHTIEAQRSSLPNSMGTFYPLLNDCWPRASRSGIDGNGKWKASHYALGKAYKDILFVISQEKNKFRLLVANDNWQAQPQRVKMILSDFEGKLFWQKVMELKTLPWGKTELLVIDSAELFKDISPASAFMQVATMDSMGDYNTSNIFYFARPKDQQLQKPRFAVRQSDATHIEISADVLARYVWIDIPGTDYHLDENFFDLLPGETVRVEVSAGRPLKHLMKQIKVRSLSDSYNLSTSAAVE